MHTATVLDLSGRESRIVLSERAYAKMSDEEAKFWREFMHEATYLIEANFDAARDEPYEPSPSLVSKYHRALIVFEGRKYHEIHRLESIFSFPAVVAAA